MGDSLWYGTGLWNKEEKTSVGVDGEEGVSAGGAQGCQEQLSLSGNLY